MRNFRKFAFGFLAAAIAGFAAGCSNLSLDENHNDVEYGSLTVADAGRSVCASDIKSCIVTVTGYDSNGNKFEKTSGTVDMSGTNGAGSATVKDIPVSKNVAVMVQAYSDSSASTKLDGIVIYAKTDIVAGSNTITVTQGTSNVGSVFAQLIASGVNTNTISDTSSITSAIPSDVNHSLIDAAAIVTDYKASSLKASSNYVKKAATVNVTPDNISGYTVQISDPNSSVNTMGTAETSYSVAPGSWTIYAIDSNGTVKASKGITVTAGGTASVTVKKNAASNPVDLTGKTILFVKASAAPTIWAWETSGSSVALTEAMNCSWSSQPTMTAVTSDYMKDYSGWYMIDFSNVASGGNISFKLNSGNQVDTGLSGCIWYDGSTSTNTNPSAPSASGEETVTITVNGSQGGGGEDLTNCIKVHAQSSSYGAIYVWDSGTSIDKTGPLAMTEESSSWNVYTINATSASIIFTKSADSWDNKTGDLSRTAAGEYWYYNSNWYDYNPDDTTAPVLVSFTSDKSGTVSGDVTFTVSATDNLNLSKAVLATSTGTTIGTISLSGTSATGTYVWSTAKIQNASYTINCTLYDAGGNKVTGNAITLTTSNANLPPVAVISGSMKPGVDKTVKYTASSSYDQNGGTIKSYAWTLTGSGATITSGASSDTLVVQTSKTEGATFTLSLTVTDNDGAASDAVTLDCTTAAVDANWDFRDETIYFLITTRFYDGCSGNNRYCWSGESYFSSRTLNDPAWRGDFTGLIEKLDYIKALGFTAIWITPVVVNASDIDYHGYHAVDFSHVDPRYADSDRVFNAEGDDISGDQAYQKLIDAVHAKGMKIIQDIVLNHCSNNGERGIIPITKKNYDSNTDGVSSYRMMGDKNGVDLNGRNVYELLGKAVSDETGEAYNDYETLRTSSLDDDTREGYMYQARIDLMQKLENKYDNDTDGKLFHYVGNFGSSDWETYKCQLGTMASDCIDLNTENPRVANYLRNCYIKYINMGVDGFRIDTLKHISRLTMNKEFIPQFLSAAAANGNDKFFMFGEACVLRNEVFNDSKPGISVCFYTWNQNNSTTDASYNWATTSDSYPASAISNLALAETHFNANTTSNQLTSDNAFLKGNLYHTPDYSKRSGLSVIDFYMHHKFKDVGNAYSAALQEDSYFNDSTWNVVYVDSHDYGPNEGGMLRKRFCGGTDEWAGNLDLMFTFRGIPCVYYGSEIEFQAGCQVEPWTGDGRVPYNQSGRAYYGDHLKGTVTASDFGEYTVESGSEVEKTLNSTLSQHIRRLNKIRAAIPALRKGQYSTDGCSGGSAAFKRRYTADGVDSFVCVAISGQGSFTGIPNGKYIDVVSGGEKTVSDGSLTTTNSGTGSMAVYVLQTNDGVEPTGKIGEDGVYLK